jgi:hypothetical protein
MENTETDVGRFPVRGRVALAWSNSHYGSNSPSRGRGRARAGHSHRVCVAHHGAVGGCSTVVSSHIGWRHKLEGFSRGESRKVGGERTYLSGGFTFGVAKSGGATAPLSGSGASMVP